MKLKQLFLILILPFALLFTSFSQDQGGIGNEGKFVVVLDAGHGGHDPGNLGNGYLEKNIALNIILKIGRILEADPNIKVIYTRKDDTFIDLYVRGEIANKANADLFVSVHCDSHSSDAHGAGTFVLGLHANKQNFEIAKKENSVIYLEDNYEKRYADYDINSPESIIGLTIMQEEFLDQSIALAKGIQDNFTGKLKRNDRKVKQAGFIVLHQTFMPSVLVETGFLTNDEEGAYLNSSRGQSEIGTSIAEAIMNYKNGMQAGTVKSNEPIVALTKTTEIKEKPKAAIPKPEPKKEAVSVAEKSPEKKQEVVPEVISEEADKEEVLAEAKPPTSQPNPVAKEVPKTVDVVENSAPKEIEAVKEEVKKPEAARVTNTENTSNGKSAEINFKVQLLASVKDIDLRSDNFKGLNKLSREAYKNMYRYMYGSTGSYEEAQLLKSNADVKGYTTSYIVAYKGGERIAISEALKYVSDK